MFIANEENECITVIVPVYNLEKHLSACLDSILGQTHRNLEVIVIDDGSTDRTGRILDEYAKRDKRIVAVHQKNMGLVRAREVGISLANSDLIGFVDGDDTIAPDMYERLYRNMKKFHADISHCGVNFCWADGKVERHYGTGRLVVFANTEGQIELLKGTWVEPALWNKLYRKELLLRSCLDLDVLNNEDLLRNFVLFQRADKTVFEDFCGYNYFQRSNSMSNDAAKAVMREKHIAAARRLMKENCKNPQVLPYAIRLWVGSGVNSVNHLYRNPSEEAKAYCKECQSFLRKNRKYIPYLTKRQQMAAGIIMISLPMHQLVYRIYRSRMVSSLRHNFGQRPVAAQKNE